MDFSTGNAVITGGASGIGLGLADNLAEEATRRSGGATGGAARERCVLRGRQIFAFFRERTHCVGQVTA